MMDLFSNSQFMMALIRVSAGHDQNCAFARFFFNRLLTLKETQLIISNGRQISYKTLILISFSKSPMYQVSQKLPKDGFE